MDGNFSNTPEGAHVASWDGLTYQKEIIEALGNQ